MINDLTSLRKKSHAYKLQHKFNTLCGFTLLEMLIVLAITTILAAISYSSWQTSVLKVRRSEATSLLMNIAVAQEQYFYQHNQYTADLSSFFGLNRSSSHSKNGFYKISITHQTQQENGIDSFTVTATAISSQRRDTDCQRFTINQLSERLAYDQNLNKTNQCWH